MILFTNIICEQPNLFMFWYDCVYSIILTLQVLYAIIFANLFFDEPLKPSLIIGGVLVIATVVYESISLKIIELRSKIVKR